MRSVLGTRPRCQGSRRILDHRTRAVSAPAVVTRICYRSARRTINEVVNIGGSQAWQGTDGARRRAIHHRLERVSTTAAAFWHDACFLVSVGELLDVSTHLIGHALREVDGVLLDVLLPDGTELPNEKSRVARVDAIASTLELDASVTKFWRKLELHKVAHRHPPFPRIDDSDFSVLLENYSNLLEIVSTEFERRFTLWVKRLDTFLTIQRRPEHFGGGHAARACSRVPSRVRVRTWMSRWAPVGVQRICCFLTIRFAITLFTVASAVADEIGSPASRRSL